MALKKHFRLHIQRNCNKYWVCISAW